MYVFPSHSARAQAFRHFVKHINQNWNDKFPPGRGF